MIDLSKISATRMLYILVGVSLFYFLVKGFQYLLIGSYIPMLFILFAMGILSWVCVKNGKLNRKTLRFWAILLLIWAIARLFLWGYLQFDKKIPESHLREQFSLVQNVISFLMLFIGIYIFKKAKHLKNQDATHNEKEL